MTFHIAYCWRSAVLHKTSRSNWGNICCRIVYNDSLWISTIYSCLNRHITLLFPRRTAPDLVTPRLSWCVLLLPQAHLLTLHFARSTLALNVHLVHHLLDFQYLHHTTSRNDLCPEWLETCRRVTSEYRAPEIPPLGCIEVSLPSGVWYVRLTSGDAHTFHHTTCDTIDFSIAFQIAAALLFNPSTFPIPKINSTTSCNYTKFALHWTPLGFLNLFGENCTDSVNYGRLFWCGCGEEAVNVYNVWLIIKADEEKGSFPIESKMWYTHTRIWLSDIRAKSRESNGVRLSVD